MNVILTILLLAAVINMLKWKVATMAMAYYIEKKGYNQPDGKEMSECTQYVVKKLFHL